MKTTKRHVNIFSFSSDPNIKNETLANQVMIAMALCGIRAHCFTSRIIDIQGADYTMKKGILTGALRSVDIVVIFGNEMDAAARHIIECVKEANKCILEIPGVFIAFGDKDNDDDTRFLNSIQSLPPDDGKKAGINVFPGIEQVKALCQFIIKGGA